MAVCRHCPARVDHPKGSSERCRSCGSTLDGQGFPAIARGHVEDPCTIIACGEQGPDSVRWENVVRPIRFVDRFVLLKLLGKGGVGQVYKAHDPLLDRDVAVKILNSAHPNEETIGRFFREARVAARLSHPNIVSVHDAGYTNACYWIAYQYIEGQTLSKVMQSGRVSCVEAVTIMRDMCNAVYCMHLNGIIHRDIKPANVIIDHLGNAILIDFGIAKQSQIISGLTVNGIVLGTPGYMSPEQAAGNYDDVDGRTDVYSLGIMLFELLHGYHPPNLPSSMPVWSSVRDSVVVRQKLCHRVPRALRKICDRALATDKRLRYQNSSVMATKLDHWLERCDSLWWLRLPLTRRAAFVAESEIR
jgi:eukaryotic-like serine/threonine-protein kinase